MIAEIIQDIGGERMETRMKGGRKGGVRDQEPRHLSDIHTYRINHHQQELHGPDRHTVGPTQACLRLCFHSVCL